MPNYLGIVMFVPLALCYATLLANNVSCGPLPNTEIKQVNASENNTGNYSISLGVQLIKETQINNDSIDKNKNELSLQNEKSLVEQISNLTSQHYEKIIIENGQDRSDSDTSESNRNGKAIFINLGPVSSSSPISPADTNTRTTSPLIRNVNGFLDSFRSTFGRILQGGQSRGLRLIGNLDQGLAKQQEGIQKSAFNLVLQGQKTAAKLYDATPKFINTLIQRIGTTRDNTLYQRLNQVVNQMRENRRNFFDAYEEHEHDFNQVFNQDVWPKVNKYLRVPDLPRTPNLTWH